MLEVALLRVVVRFGFGMIAVGHRAVALFDRWHLELCDNLAELERHTASAATLLARIERGP